MSIDKKFFDQMKVIRYPKIISTYDTRFCPFHNFVKELLFLSYNGKKHMYVDNFLPQIRKDKADYDSLPVAVPWETIFGVTLTCKDGHKEGKMYAR